VAQVPRWDVSNPAFLVTVLYVMVLLGAVVLLAGTLLGGRFFGLLSGVALAILVYLTLLQAGRIFVTTRNFTLVMLWLLGSQVVLWAGLAILLAVLKVDAVGFVIGVSVLPGSIILTTLYWWLVKNKGMLP
jgi:hypothetical protein